MRVLLPAIRPRQKGDIASPASQELQAMKNCLPAQCDQGFGFSSGVSALMELAEGRNHVCRDTTSKESKEAVGDLHTASHLGSSDSPVESW
jgi:hypothetical protein